MAVFNHLAKDMFEQRAVAFLDVLGFKELMNTVEKQPSKRTDFFSIFTIFDSHAKFDNQKLDASVPEAAKPQYIFISDSIIFSALLTYPKEGGGSYDGLSNVITKSIQISEKLLSMGYLLRGGISVGPVWHVDRNIFGNGYIDAYQTELKANDPKILLSPAAKKHWEKTMAATMHNMCLPDKDDLIANTLHPFYIAGAGIHGRIEGEFMQYRAWITTRLNSLPVGSSPWLKWWWMADAYNKALTRESIMNGKPIDREWSVD